MAETPLIPSSAVPLGFRFAATRAGIKASGRLDLACIVPDTPAAAAAMFTGNRVVAAPVVVGGKHIAATQGRVGAVVVNAGNANCATGQAGIDACERVCHAAAAAFACKAEEIFPSSTGIIGVLLPAEKLTAALPALAASLGNSADDFALFATAIMTTDTRAKAAYASVEIDGATVRILGTTKGAGMIQPRLQGMQQAAPHATMLAYLLTDAALPATELGRYLDVAVERSFNRISIDGDTSTNDTALLLASGASGAVLSTEAHRAALQQALDEVTISLAKQMVADGEGVGHVIELKIGGAHTDADALAIARSIANSPLVKTAWAGTDPNWGRLLAAIGNAGVPIDPARIGVRFGELEICRDGGLSPLFDEALAHAYLEQPEFSISIDLGPGPGTCRFWTCDLTAEYVRINADYST